nr:aminoacylase 1 [Hymenolepis microstoma]
MVTYYKCELVSPPYILFMGADKYENDKLIRWGWPEDVWFHVDKVSSAHIYLRLREGETLDDVPAAVIQDCAQLCKQNSIQGCKLNDVTIVYTMWENLRKTADMEVGQVGFHNPKTVRKVTVAKRDGGILGRLEKTATTVSPFSSINNSKSGVEDESEEGQEASVEARLRAEREARDARERAKSRAAQKAREKAEREAEKARVAEAERRDYGRMFKAEAMRSNQDGYDSDDFM